MLDLSCFSFYPPFSCDDPIRSTHNVSLQDFARHLFQKVFFGFPCRASSKRVNISGWNISVEDVKGFFFVSALIQPVLPP